MENANRSYPAGPLGQPITGNLGEFRRDSLGFFLRCARAYGDFVPLRFGPIRAFLVNRPDLIEQVFVTDHRRYIKGQALTRNRMLFGQGLLTSEGDFWRRQRKLAQPAFHRDRIARYAQIMVEKTEAALTRWQDGTTQDIHAEMMRLTLDIVTETLFGADLNVRPEVVGEALHLAQGSAEQRLYGLLPVPEWFPIPNNIRMWRAVRKLDAIIYDVIRQRRARPGNGDDLLSVYLEAHDENDGTGMTDRQLRDEALTVFLAGHETTAIALTFAWYLLAQHPEVEARLHAELDSVLGDRLPVLEDRARLPYTEWVLNEAMRLYPPAWAVVRTPIEPVTIGEYAIPSGSLVILSQWVMHRDSRYFDAPEAFCPERWNNDFARTLPKYAYFPFGGGPRVCIGNQFALMEGILLLATIARRFRLRLAPDYALRLQTAITLRPREGMPMQIRRRPPNPEQACQVAAWLHPVQR